MVVAEMVVGMNAEVWLVLGNVETPGVIVLGQYRKTTFSSGVSPKEKSAREWCIVHNL
jgi:hypothetical protein